MISNESFSFNINMAIRLHKFAITAKTSGLTTFEINLRLGVCSGPTNSTDDSYSEEERADEIPPVILFVVQYLVRVNRPPVLVDPLHGFHELR